jgi:hypothetical protein
MAISNALHSFPHRCPFKDPVVPTIQKIIQISTLQEILYNAAKKYEKSTV